MISFVPSLVRTAFRSRASIRALVGASLPALGLAAGLLNPGAAVAQEQPRAAFGTMVAMQHGRITLPDGSQSQWTGANRPTVGTDGSGRPLMTIEQTRQNALLDWEDFRLQSGEVLEFQQQRADWIAVNRVHGAQAAEIHGEIRAPGRVFVLNDNGVLVGKDAVINTRQLVTGTGVSNVTVSGNTTTITQNGPKSLLEWRGDLTLDAGEVLRIEQEEKNWIQMNRFVGGVAHVNGRVQADGHVYLVGPQGLSVNGEINAHQVLLSQLNIADDQFERGILQPANSNNERQVPQLSNYWQPDGFFSGAFYVDAELPVDANDPFRFNLTLGADAKVTTGSLGNILLFGNNVTNHGLVHAQDGQIIMAAGEHIWLSTPNNTGQIKAYSAPYAPYAIRQVSFPYVGPRPDEPTAPADRDAHFLAYQIDRIRRIGFKVDNRGEVMSERGSIDLVGFHLQQNGVMSATSTALTKGGINFYAYMRQHDYEYLGPLLLGNGEVIFGENTVTTILPDLESKDTLPLSAGLQSVGSINIFGRTLHIQKDALIYMPSGNFSAILDAGLHVFGNNKGEGANQDNEDGTRFLMESGALVDLSGWSDVRLAMESNTVSGRLFISQLKDSPLQRNGPLYRQLVEIDRRFGTNVADWTSFDNLAQATLPQLLINGGKFNVDSGNDFIMKAGAVIDVSGGALTYNAGYVYTTLLQTADGRIVDIREADPDEIYLGLANQYIVNDAKWGQSTAYYIPLMSSRRGQWEESYQHGGNAGSIEVLAPDSVFQGKVLGDVVVGKYQRNNQPTAGRFSLNDHYGDQEGEYRHNRLLIESISDLLTNQFTMETSLSTVKENLFGEEIAIGEFDTVKRTSDNGALFSDEFFNDSSMGSFGLRGVTYGGAPMDGPQNVVDAGVSLDLKNGADFGLELSNDLHFLGDFRSEGGDFSITNERGVLFAADTTIDTSAGWYSDFEFLDSIPLTSVPRIQGGNVSISARGHDYPSFGEASHQGLIMPDGMKITTDGGAWVDRGGAIKLGRAGDIAITGEIAGDRPLELNAELSALGLGGNGAFKLDLSLNHIVISDDEQATEGEDGVRITRFGTDFFKDSAFLSISLTGRHVTVAGGTALDLTAATLALKPTMADGQNTFHAPTGTSIRDLTELVSLSPALRPGQQRDGIDLTLAAGAFYDGLNFYIGDVVVGQGASIRTEAGGSIALTSTRGDVDIGGDITTGGGDFTASAFDVVLREGVTLSTAGVARVLSEVRAPDGRILREGEVLDGGDVQLSATNLTIEDGSLIDVSGAAATFDVAERMPSGAIVRTPRLIASAGGHIGLSAVELDINDATYRAHGGSETARGGGLSIGFTGATPELPEGTPDAEGYASYIETLQYYGITYEDGTPVTDFFTADLSRIAWVNFLGVDIDFPEGFTIGSRQEFIATVNQALIAAIGNPALMLVGDNLPDQAVDLPAAPDFAPALLQLLGAMGGVLPEPVTEPNPVARISLGNLDGAGFSDLSLGANGGIKFIGATSIGGFRPNGTAEIETVSLGGTLIGAADADVDIAANTIRLSANESVNDSSEPLGGGQITLTAGSNLIVEGGVFEGFGTVSLLSRGDIYGHGGAITPGDLVLQADQIYASTRSTPSVGLDGLASLIFDAGRSITVLAAADGPKTPLPYEAAGTLTLKAPRITQGGVLRSPLGTINLIAKSDGTEGSGVLTLLAGSITSASADGRVIPFGFTANGDTFLGPNGQELNSLPVKTVNLTADTLDLQTDAVIDVSGGGDLFAYEFVEGVGGSQDWLTGYRDEDFAWVDDASGVFAVAPSFDADPSQPNAGPQVYLSGGSGLKAGYYTLLPARYALLPGAFRVTSNHGKGDFANMPLGSRNDLNDGSSIQTGYLLEGGTSFRDQRNTGFMVMPGATVRQRSQYVETMANEFFQSEAYLRRALRTNLPLGTPPRTPQDGGSVVLSATSGLTLNATLKSAGAKGARGGFADINAPKIAIVSSSEMGTTEYGDDYLLLDADQLSRFGAESLLIGGVRRQGDAVLEVDVSADTVIVSNEGSVLYGPEVIFAAKNDVLLESGAKIEARGQIGGSSGDLTLVPSVPAAADDNGTPEDYDDIPIHGALEQGGLVRVSSDGLVGVLRDGEAVDRLRALLADPVALADINAKRAAIGLAPITEGGRVTIADGAQITGASSVVLDATNDTVLASGATLQTKQLSASASHVSFGAAPDDVRGLVFSGDSLGALGRIEDLVLKSYSTIDFFGPASVTASGALTLDGREIRALGQPGGVSIAADTLQLTNTSGLTATATAGGSNLALNADNLILGTGMVALSGFDATRVTAGERVIGRGVGGVATTGDLSIDAGAVTAESGAQMTIDVGGDVRVNAATADELSPFDTLGATVNIIGDTVDFAGLVDLSAGTVGLRARSGDVTLASGSVIDVTGDVSKIFDRETGAPAGNVNLTADRGDLVLGAGSTIDLSGADEGGNAGTLRVTAPLGQVVLGGVIRASAADGSRGGSFDMNAETLADFGALNARLNTAGFDYSRRFKVAQGDLTVSGETEVQNFSVAADGGSILVTGVVRTTGEDGGSIRLSAAEDLTVGAGGQLVARGRSGGSGGDVVLETAGIDGGAINLSSGSLIDVSGTGPGGRTVRLRAPQIGAGDVAIGDVSGRVVGARSVVAEAYRTYDDVETIDQAVIDQVEADAADFMAGAGATRTRLGGRIDLTAGIELRNDGDMTLTKDWNLADLRFDGQPIGLTLRAEGDLHFDANLSDGFSSATRDGALLGGESAAFTLTAGADLGSADSAGVLATGLLVEGKGSVIIGGVADTIDYYTRGTSTDLTLFRRNPVTGEFLRGCDPECHEWNDPYEFVELQFDEALNAYLDPLTGEPIARDPETGQFLLSADWGVRELPYVHNNSGGYRPPSVFGNPSGLQIDRSDGYLVRTGTGSITVAAGRDVVFEQKASTLYTAGVNSAALNGFDDPTGQGWGGQFGNPFFFTPFKVYYPENGGDIAVRAQGDILGAGSDQFPSAWLWRLGTGGSGDLFAEGANISGRPFDQTTWFIKFDAFKAGIGALGGGNVSLQAGGDVRNVSVSIPTTGRVVGGRSLDDMPKRLVTTGGGVMTIDAGGDILSGIYYVGDGRADLTAGGAIGAGDQIRGLFGRNQNVSGFSESLQDIYPLLFTSSAEFNLRSGGDLNVEAALDPLSGFAAASNSWEPDFVYSSFSPAAMLGLGYFQTYESDAVINLFSAGGDVTVWNNTQLVAARNALGSLNEANPAPIVLGLSEYGPYYGDNRIGMITGQHYLWPSKVSAVAAAGDVIVRGGFTMFPAADGNLELLAGKNVFLDLVFDLGDPTRYVDPSANNWFAATSEILISQAYPHLVPNPLSPQSQAYTATQTDIYRRAGIRPDGLSYIEFSDIDTPSLHAGDHDPVRIYAADGDVFMNRFGRGGTGSIVSPKPIWMFASDDIYFPQFTTQHNNPDDRSIYRAGGSIYFSGTSRIHVDGPGQLEIEAGRDLYIPSQKDGIQSNRIQIQGGPWKPEEDAADIAISVGFNQQPSYEAFEDIYLNPETSGEAPDYLVTDHGDGRDLSIYLIDPVYDRAGGPDQEFPTETREGLVNYVRRLQGLEPLETKVEQLAYVDQAWAAWSEMATDEKLPFYREVLFSELRTSGREATDPDSDRFQSANRGYDAIKTLFPGAEKRADEALAEGESRWTGDFETYLSVVRSNGGGDVEFVAPGGAFRLANVLAPQSNPLDAGVVTVEGGEVNIFAHDSVVVNESRILTAKGGNIMIWSSYGDIAAGRGARTSITPPSLTYKMNSDFHVEREPAGLPSGAGIGTLATVPGTPPADVDLVAPNGIVDAGDGGIRVSGNFNVFAVQILGTDNIEVGGVATGLPQPPAQPPNALDVDNAAAKAADVSEAINDAVGQVRRNTGVESPSIIEVRVVGYGDECRDERTGGPCAPQPAQTRARASASPRSEQAPSARPVSNNVVAQRTHHFQLPPQSLDQALRQLGRMTGANLVYDVRTLPETKVVSLNGDMTVDEALRRLLTGESVTWEHTGTRTIVLRRSSQN